MTILVTGATGTIGSEVVRALKAKGANVKAGVRDPEQAKKNLGVEGVAVDFSDVKLLTQAFQGVERLFLVTPFVEHFTPLVQNAVSAAKAAGVKFILRLSAFGADANSQDGLARQHGQSEVMLKESGIAWTSIQPTFFQSNVLVYQGGALKANKAFYGASNGGKVSYISPADIGEAAATILTNPTPHNGKIYVLTGPEPLTDDEVAKKLSEVAGTNISYVNLTPEQYMQGMLSAQTPEWMARHIVDLDAVKANGWAAAVTPDLKNIIGHAGETMDSYLRRNRSALV